MKENEFLQDLWDLMCGYTEYITQKQFTEKYKDYIVGVNRKRGFISLDDDHCGWNLSLQKVWSDNEK